MKAAAASVDITPPLVTDLCGYFHQRHASGVHDPLLAKALVIEDDDRAVAIVACDLIALPRELGIPETMPLPRRNDWRIGMVGFGGIARTSHAPAYHSAGWPVVAVAGKGDDIFPIEAVREAFDRLETIYRAAGAEQNCHLVVGDGGHRFYAEAGWAKMLPMLTNG